MLVTKMEKRFGKLDYKTQEIKSVGFGLEWIVQGSTTLVFREEGVIDGNTIVVTTSPLKKEIYEKILLQEGEKFYANPFVEQKVLALLEEIDFIGAFNIWEMPLLEPISLDYKEEIENFSEDFSYVMKATPAEYFEEFGDSEIGIRASLYNRLKYAEELLPSKELRQTIIRDLPKAMSIYKKYGIENGITFDFSYYNFMKKGSEIYLIDPII